MFAETIRMLLNLFCFVLFDKRSLKDPEAIENLTHDHASVFCCNWRYAEQLTDAGGEIVPIGRECYLNQLECPRICSN
jgi:hypothetical protein